MHTKKHAKYIHVTKQQSLGNVRKLGLCDTYCLALHCMWYGKVHTYTGVYLLTYIHTCMYAGIHACMLAYMHAYTHTYAYAQAQTRVQTYKHPHTLQPNKRQSHWKVQCMDVSPRTIHTHNLMTPSQTRLPMLNARICNKRPYYQMSRQLHAKERILKAIFSASIAAYFAPLNSTIEYFTLCRHWCLLCFIQAPQRTCRGWRHSVHGAVWSSVCHQPDTQCPTYQPTAPALESKSAPACVCVCA